MVFSITLKNSLKMLLALILALTILYPFELAHAEVRESDVIGYHTVAESSAIAAHTPSISANCAFVVDEYDNVYFQRNPDLRNNIASITKIMTAIIALDEAPLDFEIKISQYAASVGESSADLRTGDILTLKDALIGLIIPSGNDAATAIAECVGAKILSESKEEPSTEDKHPEITAFVNKMNAKAKELGCNDTLFANPHGLDENEFKAEMYSTARDVSKMCAYGMKNETFREIAAGTTTVVNAIRKGNPVELPQRATDLLIGNFDGACGIKTGFTELAGSCFAGACNRDGKYVYAVVLDAPDNDQRFYDTQILFNWVYASQKEVQLANCTQTATLDINGTSREVPIVAQAAHSQWDNKSFAVTFADPDAKISASSIFGNIGQKFTITNANGTIEPGQVVGKCEFFQHNELVATQDLIACERVDGPSILEMILLTWKKITGQVTEDSISETVINNEVPILVQKA